MLQAMATSQDDLGESLLTSLPDLKPRQAWWRRTVLTIGEGSTPGSMLCLAITFGTIAGLFAFVYYLSFEGFIRLVWEVLPTKLVQPGLEHLHARWPDLCPPMERIAWVYTLLAAATCGTLSGTVQLRLGIPGDLPEMVRSIHETGSIPIRTMPALFISSAFGIAAGGSLGPEAALVGLCGATVSWTAKHVFKCKPALLRQCTLMGMSAALAAFFGVTLGGSLFALEVLHRTGLQYFEVVPYATVAGATCVLVFRGLCHKPFGSIWDFGGFHEIEWWHLLLGCAVGLTTGVLAIGFTYFHKALKRRVARLGLHEHHTPVLAGLLGGLAVAIIGVLLPPTMFWGEYEIATIADPVHTPLPHVWPPGGVWSLGPFLGGNYPPWLFAVLAAAKLLAISLSVIAGFRGGFIFPLFFVGASLSQGANRALAASGLPSPFSDMQPALLSMTAAAGLTTAITRTPLSTPIILMALSGQAALLAPCLCAALAALFVSLNVPFMDSQRDRADIIFKYIKMSESEPLASAATLSNGVAQVPAAAVAVPPMEAQLTADAAHGLEV